MVVALLLLLSVGSAGQSLQWLGTFGGVKSYAFGVSADGSVVVGAAYNASSQRRAFRWENGVMHDLGTLGWDESVAIGVSADGSVVAGWAGYRGPGTRSRAFRWTPETGMQDLGTLGGDWSAAWGVSADGRVVVGEAQNASGQWRAFRWENGVMQDLGTLGGGDSSGAGGVSADGRVVVGWAWNARGQRRAFRWMQETGMQNLGTLGGDWSWAWRVSADGKVVVGWAAYTLERAFWWTQETGMQNLGTLGGRESEAWGVSADGRVVVGWAENASGDLRAFRWTPAGGMEDLNQTYASLLTDGSALWEAYAISPDGRYIVGYGYNASTGHYEAFLLDTGPLNVEPSQVVRGGLLLEVTPNPVEGSQVRIRLAAPSAAELRIIDTRGQVVHRTELAAGEQSVTLETAALASGVYRVVLRCGGEMVSAPLVVIR